MLVTEEACAAAVQGATMPQEPRQTDFQLVRVKSTWSRIKKGEALSNDEDEVTLSEATIGECVSEGGISWIIEAPIYFCYKVVETYNILEPSNTTLLWGHITDPQQIELATASKRKLRRFIVIDEVVDKLYGSKVREYFEENNVQHKILALPTTEETKSMDLVLNILHEVQNFSLDRRTEPIIAIGGGVCLDIVGLAASLYRRRTPYIRVPTTLLSYVDASVGAKNGVNFLQCKNKLGGYTPPVASFLDRSFLQSIPRRHISNGLGEILKMALMKHKGLFDLLKNHGKYLLDTKFQSCNSFAHHGDAALQTTRIAIETMLEELAPNLWEDDLDRLVDFGHLISPELEMRVLPSLMHGEAVNIDMAFMTYVAHARGLLAAEDKEQILQCMRGLELPVWHSGCSWALIQRALRERLKHSGGQLRMPLPTGLGVADIFNDTSEETLEGAYELWVKDCKTGLEEEVQAQGDSPAPSLSCLPL